MANQIKTALSTITILTQQADVAWHPIAETQQSMVIDLDRGSYLGEAPYPTNLPGWVKYFNKHQIEHIDLYQPDQRVLPIIAAAAIKELSIVVYLTGAASSRTLDTIKKISSQVVRFICPARFIAEQLRKINIDCRKIQTVRPNIATTDELANRTEFKGDSLKGKYLLALATCENTHAMHQTILAAALLYHATSERMTLVVNSDCSAEKRAQLKHWQQACLAPDLVHIDTEPGNWPYWLNEAECLLAPCGPLRELTRLLYAAQTGIAIVTAGDGVSVLSKSENIKIALNGEPRNIARAALESCSALV